MTNEIFVKIVVSIITLCGALVSAYVIPFIHSKITREQMDLLSYYVSVAVRCAEQIYTPEQWADKKVYVFEYAKSVIEQKLYIKLSDDDINTIIEGIVNEIKHSGE